MLKRLLLRAGFAGLISVAALNFPDGLVQRASADPTPPPREVISIGNPVDLPLTPTQRASDEQFRRTFGFNADPNYIANLYARVASGTLPGADRTWAALLTPDEATEMTARLRLIKVVGPGPEAPATSLTPFGAYLAAHAAEFGGEYFDQSAGGAITVLFTRNLEAHRAALASILGPASARLRVAPVANTYGELQALTLQIAADAPWLFSHGIALSQFGPDIRANTVNIGLVEATSDAVAVLQSRYAGRPWRTTVAGRMLPQVKTIPDSQQWLTGETATEAPPMMGALMIWNNVKTCTSGFVVTNGSQNGVLSAGHCGADSGWNQGTGFFAGLGSYFVGSTSTFVVGIPGDAEVIPLFTQTDASNLIYISTTSCGFLCTSHNERIIQGSEATTNVGELVCHSLSNELNEFCGSVTATGQCVTVDGQSNLVVCNLFFSNLSGTSGSTAGDSGSPAYQTQPNGTSIAQGIVSGILTSGPFFPGTTYTQIQAAFNAIAGAGGGTWSIHP